MKNFIFTLTNGDRYQVRAANIADAKSSLPAGSIVHYWSILPTARQVRRTKSLLHRL